MEFLDMCHIRKISEALWGTSVGSRAAVMIGTGFSANAQKASLQTADMPLWNTLRQMMLEELGIADSGMDALTVADLYESSFGKRGLEEFLMKKIPDREYEPGELHKMLLELPWSDVFTTNYDTLLERTNEKLVIRQYSNVYAAEDIPLCRPPRIVKLHGTFQRKRPLIFSHEDYRKYPNENAPFVNMVQQAIMENIFCLIGFSGTDPNFLQWIGWVRDNLKEYRPIIYLCGLLDLDNHQRKMLERINIQPIDLTPKFPRHKYTNNNVRHQEALKWFLQQLRDARPQSPYEWLDNANMSAGITDNSNNNQITEVSEPQKNITWAQLNSVKKSLINEESVRDICSQLRAQRESYPGWLVAPYGHRHKLFNLCKRQQPFLLRVCAHDAVSSITKLELLYEIHWRNQCSLLFVEGSFIQEAIKLTEMINPFPGILQNNSDKIEPKIGDGHDWEKIKKQWLTLQFAIVKFFRIIQDGENFNKWFNLLKPIVLQDSHWSMVWYHELALWNLSLLNMDEMTNTLENWQVNNAEPIWKLRKAAIQLEIGSENNARELILQALADIQDKEIKVAREDYSLLSVESCCLLLMLIVGDRSCDKINVYERLHELGKTQCNVRTEINYLLSQIKEYSSTYSKIQEYGYDPGHIVTTRSYRSHDEEIMNAMALLNILEIIAMPLGHNSFVGGEYIARAVEWIKQSLPQVAISMLIRCDRKNDLEKYFQRFAVDKMEQKDIEMYFHWFMKKAEIVFSHLQNSNLTIERKIYLYSLLALLLNIVSRLVYRLEQEEKKKVYDFLFSVSIDNSVPYNPNMTKVLMETWYRLIYCSQGDMISAYMGKFLKLPWKLNEKDLDPVSYLLLYHAKGEITKPDCTNSEWREVFYRLINNLTPISQYKLVAAMRLIWLWKNNVLSREECDVMAERLWSDKNTDTEFPFDIGLYNYQLLSLPGDSNTIVARYEKYIQDNDFGNISDYNLQNIEGVPAFIYGSDCLYAVECGKVSVNSQMNYIPWDATKGSMLLDKLDDFFANNQKQLESMSNDRDLFLSKEDRYLELHRLFMLLGRCLGRLILPYNSKLNSSQREKIKRIYNILKEKCNKALCIEPFRLYMEKNAADNIRENIERGLLSGNKTLAKDAMGAVYEWINFKAPQECEDIFDTDRIKELISSLIDIIYYRKQPCLTDAIQYITMMLRQQDELGIKDIIDDNMWQKIVNALSYIFDDIIQKQEELSTKDNLIWYQKTAVELVYVVYQIYMAKKKYKDVFDKWSGFINGSHLPEIEEWRIEI